MDLTLDLDAGLLSAGVAAWSVAATGDGCVRVAGGGPALAPVSWAARAAAVGEALGCAEPEAALGRRILTAATRAPGEPSAEAELLALHLAGAGRSDAPFTTTLIAVARATGWGPDVLTAMPAADVDDLAAAALDEAEDDESWTIVRFASEAHDGPVSASELRSRLARRLLVRARGAAGVRVGGAASDAAPAPLLERRASGGPDGASPHTKGSANMAPAPRERSSAFVPQTRGGDGMASETTTGTGRSDKPQRGSGPSVGAIGAGQPRVAAPPLPAPGLAAGPSGSLDAFAAALGWPAAQRTAPRGATATVAPRLARRGAGSGVAPSPGPAFEPGGAVRADSRACAPPTFARRGATPAGSPGQPGTAAGTVAVSALAVHTAPPRSHAFDGGSRSDEIAALLEAEADLRGVDP